MWQVNSSPVLRYSFAVLTVALATVVTSLIHSLYTRTPFALYFIAVMVTTLYCGRGAGLAATALSALASAYFVIPPFYSLAIGFEGVLMLASFVFVALVISSLTERLRRARATARQSNLHLSTTLMSIGDAVIATDDKGLITLMNSVAQSLTGWTLEEARGKNLKNVFRIINEQTRLEVESPVERVLREGIVVGLANHTILLAKDGREIPIDDSGAPIRDDEGHITGVVLVFRDISEIKQTDLKMRFQAHLLDVVEQAVMATDFEGRITYWNHFAEKLYGWKAEEVMGRNIVDVTASEMTKEQAAEIMSQLQKGESWSGDFLVRHKDGTTFPVRVTDTPVYDEHGNQVGIVGSSEDITERRRAEEIRERLAAIVESSDDAILSKTLNGWITSWNEGAEKMYGYTPEEAIGQHVSLITPPERKDQLNEILETIRRGERMKHLETVRLRKDGTRVDVSVSISPIKDSSEKIIGASTIARDITERKRSDERRAEMLAREQAARTQAELANRTKDEFLATLSHELRTPLTAMLGWTWMLRARDVDQQTYNHALETIERNVRAQAQLIDDLLDVSRIITGKLRLEVVPAELIPVIEAAIDTARPAAKAKEIKLQIELDPHASHVVCDPARMQQVIWNLLSNAVKFTPRHGLVRMRLMRAGSHIEISVCDTGPGISPEFMPYVFDRFRQADSTTTRAHGGLGLGLAIVRHLVELHGGTVRVESEGEGSIFTVSLPVMAVSDEYSSRTIPARSNARNSQIDAWPSLEGLRILVVDDEEDARDLLVATLERCGAQMTAAASTIEALDLLKSAPPDVLVSDIGMPVEDGYMLMRKVRELEQQRAPQQRLPAVALTAYASDGARETALAAGFDIHLAKPVEPLTLIETIAGLVKQEEKA